MANKTCIKVSRRRFNFSLNENIMNSSNIYLVLFVLVRTYITDYKTSPRDVYVGLFWVHLWTCPHAKIFVTFHFFFPLISFRSRLVFLSFEFRCILQTRSIHFHFLLRTVKLGQWDDIIFYIQQFIGDYIRVLW